ncbi:MAG: hypothetical protein Q8N96_01595 [Methylovulum sp.]|nr:hypothetical protein [Methylovulum sp.]
MTKTIFLHIGIPKTGTSSIQNFFYQKREELKSHGLLYPITASSGLGTEHYLLSDALGFGKKHRVNEREKELSDMARSLEKEIKKSSAHSVLFSSECFYIPNDIEPVKAFFSDYEVCIVVYLRRHDTWWPSAYSQTVKTVKSPPWNRSIEAYINFSKNRPQRPSYRTLVDRWAKVFGKENMIIRPYEGQQNQPDLIADILTAINFQSAIPLKSTIGVESKNQSLPYAKLSLIDIYQRANIDPNIRNRLINSVLSQPSNNQESNSLISPKLQLQLIEENMADYEYIAREYLGREDGKLFYDPLPDPDTPWHAPKHPTFMSVVEQTIQGLG